MYLLSYINECQISLLQLKNKSRISLVKFVVLLLYFGNLLFLARRKITFEVRTFGGSLLLAFANTCEILSLLSKAHSFRGVVTLGILRYRGTTVQTVIGKSSVATILGIEQGG